MADTLRIKSLSNMETAVFCDQMAMILHSGISTLEGLSIMKKDAATDDADKILSCMLDTLEITGNFHTAITSCGVFPKYVLDMVEIGVQTGKLDEVMAALANHYKREESISKGIKSAITYPFIMISMMFAVILVLIIKVLPIFNQVFKQLGGEMTGLARGIMNFGTLLYRYSIIFVAILAVFVLLVFYLTKSKSGKAYFVKFAAGFPLTRKLCNKIAVGRLASGLALTLSSGLDTDQSLALMKKLVNHEKLQSKIVLCERYISDGSGFSEAINQAGIFSGMYAQMVSIGFRTGSLDEVMVKIADQYESEIDTDITNMISVLEPSLVATLSIIVGMILLSVMLPLMGIMSSVG